MPPRNWIRHKESSLAFVCAAYLALREAVHGLRLRIGELVAFFHNDDQTEGVVCRCGEGCVVCASRDRRGRVILA